MPKARRSKATSATPKSDTFSPLEEVGEFFEDISKEQRAIARSMVAWARHPLGTSLDDAETTPAAGKEGPASVDAAWMERKLREVLASTPAPVYLVRSSEPVGSGSSTKDKPSWVVIIGDGDDLGKALAELTARAEGLSEHDLPFRDVVLWTRRWDAATWERATAHGLGAMEERPIWLKVWESSGSLLGPLRFLR